MSSKPLPQQGFYYDLIFYCIIILQNFLIIILYSLVIALHCFIFILITLCMCFTCLVRKWCACLTWYKWRCLFPVSWGSHAKFTCGLFITQEISTVDSEHIKNRVFIFKSTAPKTGPSIRTCKKNWLKNFLRWVKSRSQP